MWIGMSGYSYPEWKGNFYPPESKPKDFLPLYAERLSTVEINNTFYRFPTAEAIDEWKRQTPDHFRFSFKANRRITHLLRLGPESAGQIVDFVGRCAALGPRLACVLFQLPPNFARDDARLELLLASLPAGPRYAVEFRHASWFADEVLKRLANRNVACVAGDSEDRPERRLATADFVYARLRRGQYSEAELDGWDAWFREQAAARRDVLAYVKHDQDGTAPTVVEARWGQAKLLAAREVLQETLASPRRRAVKRPRKSG
jgi:uncharacterized protein YecE (DUF72 family)